jgi:hypothetical protein
MINLQSSIIIEDHIFNGLFNKPIAIAQLDNIPDGAI